jgi:hypothetical protein
MLVMDLYSLLRFERDYGDRRKKHERNLRSKSGVLLSVDEYYTHRPKQCEIVVSYDGDNHTQRYIRYYKSIGASNENFNDFDAKYVVERIQAGKPYIEERCIDTGRPVVSLFVPDTPLDKVEVVVCCKHFTIFNKLKSLNNN